ncbi:hypothetical protein KKH43_01600, partial [Patescibacteria group bacterium]|nr:hypothetical protein [Patescibacteria group bacterium]
QGFTELEITPFALPLERLIDAAKKTILKHHKEGKLFGTKKNQDDESEPLKPVELLESDPLWINEEYRDADISGKLIYYPKSYNEDHQGKTKLELLEESKTTPFSGFNVYLREKSIIIPKESKGKVQADRLRLQTNTSSEGYLNAFQNREEYKNEHGQTLEDWLTQLLTYLEKHNQIIDSRQNYGSSNNLVGSYHDGWVLHVGWIYFTGGFHVEIDGGDPWNNNPNFGSRPVVKIPSKMA